MKTLLMIGRCAVIVGLACILLSLLGRATASTPHPTPTQTQNYRPATDRERLDHELRQAWENDQVKKG